MAELPVEPALPELRRALRERGLALLLAPPGAGKSTRVPLALLHEPWLGGLGIVVLQPRRIAARAVAARMAATLGQPLGAEVGYQVRMERRVSAATRIEVVTEGILTRRLQADPGLAGVGLVVFDEFHERGLHAELALALARRVQAALRPELRLLVMSATLDGEALSRALGGAPVVACSARSFPVAVRFAREDEVEPERDPAPAVAAAVARALRESPGDVLAFLPGGAEIRRAAEALAGLPDVDLRPLHGGLSLAEQQAALDPGPRRRVVLATNVAETSLTIEGVGAVVDSGLARRARFDPALGLSRLLTARISRASAEQRAGRAGRIGPGVAYRLWSERSHASLAAADAPEILEADLVTLALELAIWGEADGELSWITPPPAGALAAARRLLRELGALRDGKPTPRGRELHALGTHPRLAQLLLEGRRLDRAGLACDVAALLEERDPLPRDAGADLASRVEALRAARRGRGAGGRFARHHELAAAFRSRLGVAEDEPQGVDAQDVGRLVASAFPERVAQARAGERGRFRLAGGRGVRVAAEDPLAAEPWLAVAHAEARDDEGRVLLAAALDPEQLPLERHESLGWDAAQDLLLARETWRYGALTVRERPLPEIGGEARARLACSAVREQGLGLLPFDEGAHQWQARVLSLRSWGRSAEFPDVADAALLGSLEAWLGPWLGAIRRRADFGRVPLPAALEELLDPAQRRRLAEWAPTHAAVPSGSRIRLRYSPLGEPPVLAVRLQEIFGWRETPTVNGGRTRVLLHLLSPAQRPLQVTQDLRSFWEVAYPAIRSQLRARYPRHSWPEDPLTAVAVRGATRRRPR